MQESHKLAQRLGWEGEPEAGLTPGGQTHYGAPLYALCAGPEHWVLGTLAHGRIDG